MGGRVTDCPGTCVDRTIWVDPPKIRRRFETLSHRSVVRNLSRGSVLGPNSLPLGSGVQNVSGRRSAHQGGVTHVSRLPGTGVHYHASLLGEP